MKPEGPLWLSEGGRAPTEIAQEYMAGQDIILDQQFIKHDLNTLEAHMLMLNKVGLISGSVLAKTLGSLEKIRVLDAKGEYKLQKELEDVHSNIESTVIKDVGIENGGWLRLGVARNDQIYTDTRMYMREHVNVVITELLKLIDTLLELADGNLETVMPGYTHLRISQPITLAHWLTAKVSHLFDDIERLEFTFGQINDSPLGIVEMAGTHLTIDRQYEADLLGFDGVLENSLYASNSRGEVEAVLLCDLSLLMLHCRRMVQELILWSSYEFGFIELDDGYTTGGTAQPNLRNPDALEMVRAKAPKVYSKLNQVIAIMDILPSGYNRDTQETKSCVFEAVDIVEKTIPVLRGVVSTMKLNKERMRSLSGRNFATAPDVTTQLAFKSGIDFRSCYLVVKKLIRGGYLKESFAELTPELLSKVSRETIGKEVKVKKKDLEEVLDPVECALSHDSLGGPAPKEVARMIKEQRKKVREHINFLEARAKKLNSADEKLAALVVATLE
ncbi:MAG: argininosuccinate lyase [Candidatus Bathyarchaeia archaeon]|jgi:argininosuccinate lyase